MEYLMSKIELIMVFSFYIYIMSLFALVERGIL